jgi:hypothetical protein
MEASLGGMCHMHIVHSQVALSVRRNSVILGP